MIAFRVLLACLIFSSPVVFSAQPAPALSAPDSENQAFADLAAEYWETQMRLDPLWATFINHPGYDDKLEDNSEAGYRRQEETLRGILGRLNTLNRSKLVPSQQISFDVLKLRLERSIDWFSYKFYEWEVDHMDGMHKTIPDTIGLAQPMQTERDAQALIKRIKAMPGYFKNQIAHLRHGAQKNLVSAKMPVVKSISQIEEMLALSVEETPYAQAADRLPEGLRKIYKRQILKAAKNDAYAACKDYLNFLKNEALPRARPDTRPGLFYLPDGASGYTYKVRYHTTADKSPEELHQIGLQELKSLHAEIAEIAKRMKYSGDTKAFMAKVRNDPSNYFKSREEMMKSAETLVAKTKAKLSKYFGILPKTDLIVKAIEPYKEKNDASARYYPPSEDSSRPGIYYLNTYQPETRQRFSMVSLAAHEGVPGHHLQFAIALEQKDLPAFRRHGSVTAFVEGWALYAERLAEEMGLYEDDLSRLGMLSDQAWRACRLVVDTGLHAKGWSRQEAIDFMKANTMVSDEEIASEIDRYIIWPGQALAYKVGQREIMAIRKELQAKKGNQFDIRAFHDAVLKNGALPLPILRKLVLES